MVTVVPTWGHATEIWHREGVCRPHPASDSWQRPRKLPFCNLSPNFVWSAERIGQWMISGIYRRGTSLLPRLSLLWSIQVMHCSSTWCHGWLMFSYCHDPKFGMILFSLLLSALRHPVRMEWTSPNGRCQDIGREGSWRAKCHFNVQGWKFKDAGTLLDGNDDAKQFSMLQPLREPARQCLSLLQQLRIHNTVLYLFVLSPLLPADASMVLETTCRALDFAFSSGVNCDQLVLWVSWLVHAVQCFQAIQTFWIFLKLSVEWSRWSVSRTQADNCPRENKNGSLIKFLTYLVAQGRVRMSSILFSTKGHTHNALGFLALHFFWTSKPLVVSFIVPCPHTSFLIRFGILFVAKINSMAFSVWQCDM